jgi:hypothetical protein
MYQTSGYTVFHDDIVTDEQYFQSYSITNLVRSNSVNSICATVSKLQHQSTAVSEVRMYSNPVYSTRPTSYATIYIGPFRDLDPLGHLSLLQLEHGQMRELGGVLRTQPGGASEAA